MQVTLRIKNANENLLKDLKNIVSLYPQATLQVTKEQDITDNGYTHEFEQEILQDLQNINNQRKKGILKTYKSVEEAFKGEGIL